MPHIFFNHLYLGVLLLNTITNEYPSITATELDSALLET